MDYGVGSSRKPASTEFVVWLLVGLVATGAFLFGGHLVKDRCLHDLLRDDDNNRRGWFGQQYSSNCYSDISALYSHRGFSKNHPIAYRDNKLEYPALTGLFITAVNAPVPTERIRGFYLANVIALVPFALLGTVFLVAIGTKRWRILYFAAAPAILAYAFHNWDLIPVGFTAGAMWAFARRRDGLAGILLGLGAAAKLYPAFLVPVFLAARWGSPRDERFGMSLTRVVRNPRGRIGRGMQAGLAWTRNQLARPAVRGFLAAGVGFALPNVIVLLLAGFDGWWYPWQFQGKRSANYETSWFFIQRHLIRFASDDFWMKTYPIVAQWTSTLIFVASGAVLVWRELKRERFRPFVTSFGIVLLFLITAKVYSPQYALWLLPFFVLAGIPFWGYGLFVVSDLFVLGAIWWYLTSLLGPEQIGTHPPEQRLNVLEAAVWFRYAALLVILWLSRRAPELADHSTTDSLTATVPAV